MLFVLSVLFSLESVDLPPGHEIKTPLTIIRANADLLEILAQIQKKELVSDIEPMLFSHVFERFYRMDRSRNSETGGHFHYHKHFFSE